MFSKGKHLHQHGVAHVVNTWVGDLIIGYAYEELYIGRGQPFKWIFSGVHPKKEKHLWCIGMCTHP